MVRWRTSSLFSRYWACATVTSSNGTSFTRRIWSPRSNPTSEQSEPGRIESMNIPECCAVPVHMLQPKLFPAGMLSTILISGFISMTFSNPVLSLKLMTCLTRWHVKLEEVLLDQLTTTFWPMVPFILAISAQQLCFIALRWLNR